MHMRTPNRSSAEEEADDLVAEARGRATGIAHYPNHISGPLRRRYVLQSIAITAYAAFGLYVGKIVLPAKLHAFVFKGVPAFVLVAAMLMAILNMLSVVLDHHDKRDNELNYERFAEFTRMLGWLLLGLATILQVLQI